MLQEFEGAAEWGAGGWWRSGDAGHLDSGGLTLLSRQDGALRSGVETVSPEVLEGWLAAAAQGRGLPLEALQQLTATWRPADRPRRWHLCRELAPNAAGKWERSRWRRWISEA